MDRIVSFFDQYFSRLTLPKFTITDLVEILIITFVIYHVINWIKKTRAWYLVKGLSILVVVWFLASIFELNAIIWIFLNTITVGIIALIIIFQPSFRLAL